MHDSATKAAQILCVGMGWFPKTPGGLDRYVYELTHQLANSHDRVELCGIGLPDSAGESSMTLTNLAAPDSNLLKRLWSTSQQFAQYRRERSTSDRLADAINLHFALYSLPLLPQLPKHIPVTFTFHGPWALESQWEGQSKWGVFFKYWVEQQVYRRCDRFIVLSKAFGQILHREYGVPWDKIHIIPGGVNTTRFQSTLSRQEARAKLGWHPDRTILFTPRRLVNRMGLDKLVQAIAHVKAQVPDVWLAIAGKGPLRESLEQQVQKLGLQDQVKLLGFLPDEDLPLAYQAADLMVMPSQSLEGFGLTLLESLACGTPVLCTPVGGMPEVVEALSPDLVTRSVETDAIVDRLVELLTDKDRLPSRTACRTYACDRFDWKVIAQQVRQVLLLPKDHC